MMLNELYQRVGGDAEETVRRLGTEAFLIRMLKKFVDDESFSQLRGALLDDDCKTAFRAAHTLKGVCANLGFEELYGHSSQITEKLREGNMQGAAELFPDAEKSYHLLVGLINEL